MTESPDRLRLLFVVSSLAVGGPQKSLLGLLERLDVAKFDVSLLVLEPLKGAFAEFVPATVTVMTTPDVVTAATLPKGRMVWAMRCLMGSLMRQRRPVAMLSLLCELFGAWLAGKPSQQIRQRVWAHVGDILPTVEGAFDAAVGILGLSTYAVVDLVEAKYKYHWVRSDSRILARDEAIEARYFAKLDGALAVSATCEEVFVTMYPQMRGRTRVYKNDIPRTLTTSHEQWPPIIGPTATKILTVTRLDPLKGLDLAVAACSLLVARRVPVSWLVLGEGPENAFLQSRIKALGLEGRFTLGGAVIDTTAFLDEADVYVHPSRSEGRSNAVEEARARGKAIIATRYATVGDQVSDGQDGLLCDLDAISLADTIECLAADSQMRTGLGTAAAAAYASERDDPNWLFENLAKGVVPPSFA